MKYKILPGAIGELCEYASVVHIVTSHVLYDWAKADAAVSNTNQMQQRFIVTKPPLVEVRNLKILLLARVLCS